jgi:hypothetical protein
MLRAFCVLVVAVNSACGLRGQSSVTLPYFTVTDLGVLQGMQTSTATGISSSGIVLGYSSPATAGAPVIVGQGFTILPNPTAWVSDPSDGPRRLC